VGTAGPYLTEVSVNAMFYVVGELTRRRTRSISTVAGFAVATAVAVMVAAVALGLDHAQSSALHPLGRLGADLLVTRSGVVPRGAEAQAADQVATATENATVDQANLLDISKLGNPGDQFAQDFFLPSTLPTFPSDRAAEIARLARVNGVATGLVVDLVHRAGTVPKIVAEFRTAARVIDLSPPTPAEQAATDACVAKLPLAQQTSAGVFSCLPARLKEVRTQQEVLRQVVSIPSTDIRTTNLRLGGIDPAARGQGLLTPASIVSGAFLGRGSREAIVSETYAERAAVGVGSVVDVHGTSLTVVGIARPPVGGVACDVYLPLGVLQQLADRPMRISLVMVKAVSSVDVGQVSREIAGVFPDASVTDAAQASATVTGSLVAAAHIAGGVRLILIVLVLAGAGGNAWLVTLSSIRRRTSELGVLRAVGWSRLRIVRQVITEATVLGALGGLAGIAVGIAAAAAVGRLAPGLELHDLQSSAREVVHVQPVVDLFTTVGLLLAAVAVAFVAGVLGGSRAARIRPSEALRDIE
jgi:hypothetical protein